MVSNWKKTCLILIAGSFVAANGQYQSNWENIVNTVNSLPTGWKAQYHPFLNSLSPTSYKKMAGTILDNENNITTNIPVWFRSLLANIPEDEKQSFEIFDSNVPDDFDSRDYWPHCSKIMNHIRDQGNCANDWAVAATSVLNAGLCIANKIDGETFISTEDLTACSLIGGCYGGFITLAWLHIKHEGVVTGGDYESNEGCRPYSIPPCLYADSGCLQNCSYYGNFTTPKCVRHCTNNRYRIPFKQDLHKAKNYFVARYEKNIQKTIMESGPVQTSMLVYEDFLTYVSGTYHHITGQLVGGLSVTILGWGVENDSQYWICTNSWNKEWGQNGFFRMRRGLNDCDIERKVFSASF